MVVRRIKTPARRSVVRKPAGKPEVTSGATGKVRRPPPGKTGKVNRPNVSDEGDAGFAKASQKRAIQEAEYEKQKETPFDFYLSPGDQAELIILDGKPPKFYSFHRVQLGPKRWGDEICLADSGQPCPLCDREGKPGSYTMVLTALDRRPYKIKKGPNAGKVIKASKKLVKVSGRNLPKFERQWKGNAKGNYRGMLVLFHRTGEKEARIGEDIEFKGRVPIENLKKFGAELTTPPNYDKIFEPMTPKEMALKYSVKKGAVAGAEEFEGEGEDYGDDLESVGWDN